MLVGYPASRYYSSVMNPRKRFAIGLVLLAAITLSFVESAAAAICPPMTDMNVMEDMVDMTASPADDDAAGDHGGEQDDRSAGDCPFAPAGAAQSCASASLPAVGFDLLAAPFDVVAELNRTEIEPHLVLASVLFHPPKS